MEYKILEQKIDLNDPKSGFSFSSDGDQVDLRFIDWKNRKVIFKFYATYAFTYRITNGWKNFPEAHFLEILGSDIIQALRKNHSASPEEELHHYIISTNEDEWCEIIAERFDLKKEE